MWLLSARRSVGLGFDFQPPREEVFQLSFEFHDRQVTIGQRCFELGAANLRLRTLVGHALETHTMEVSLERRDSIGSTDRDRRCAA